MANEEESTVEGWGWFQDLLVTLMGKSDFPLEALGFGGLGTVAIGEKEYKDYLDAGGELDVAGWLWAGAPEGPQLGEEDIDLETTRERSILEWNNSMFVTNATLSQPGEENVNPPEFDPAEGAEWTLVNYLPTGKYMPGGIWIQTAIGADETELPPTLRYPEEEPQEGMKWQWSPDNQAWIEQEIKLDEIDIAILKLQQAQNAHVTLSAYEKQHIGILLKPYNELTAAEQEQFDYNEALFEQEKIQWAAEYWRRKDLDDVAAAQWREEMDRRIVEYGTLSAWQQAQTELSEAKIIIDENLVAIEQQKADLADKAFDELSAEQQALFAHNEELFAQQVLEWEREYDELTAINAERVRQEDERLAQEAHQFETLSAYEQATLDLSQFQWENLSAAEQAQFGFDQSVFEQQKFQWQQEFDRDKFEFENLSAWQQAQQGIQLRDLGLQERIAQAEFQKRPMDWLAAWQFSNPTWSGVPRGTANPNAQPYIPIPEGGFQPSSQPMPGGNPPPTPMGGR
jgi:hypothetical protein